MWVSSEVGASPHLGSPGYVLSVPCLPAIVLLCATLLATTTTVCHTCTFSFQFFIVLLIILLAELILLILFFVYMDKVSLQEWRGV